MSPDDPSPKASPAVNQTQSLPSHPSPVSRNPSSTPPCSPGVLARPCWRTTMLSPSPSPSPQRDIPPPLHDNRHFVNETRSKSTPTLGTNGLRSDDPKTPSGHSSVPPLPTYRSPSPTPLLPRLGSPGESSPPFKLHSPPRPTGYHHSKETYPTPDSVNAKWPCPWSWQDRPAHGTPLPCIEHRPCPPRDEYLPPIQFPVYTDDRDTKDTCVKQPHAPGWTHTPRPRLSIHPYAEPRPEVQQQNNYSAEAPGAGQVYSLAMGAERGYSGSPGGSTGPNANHHFKAPRKRADDLQLNVLHEVFDRTQYPSTEERDHLARRLGMTSRSVQIWFQNRRRAVKVDQQSAVERAEAVARSAQASSVSVNGPGAGPYLTYPGGPSPSSQATHLHDHCHGHRSVPSLVGGRVGVKREAS